MRQQFLDPAGPVRGQPREHVLQVGIGIVPVHPSRLHQTHHRGDVFDYIEAFYNRTRRHSHLGGISPEAFERASA